MRRVLPSRKQATFERIATMVAEIMNELGLTRDGSDASGLSGGTLLAAGATDTASTGLISLARGTVMHRRFKQLINLLVHDSADWEETGTRTRHPAAVSALGGALQLACTVDDPRISAALRDAVMRHLLPDGA